MLGEMHESVQEHALLNKLVATPGFSERVKDIVVESCNSLYQGIMDPPIDWTRVETRDDIAPFLGFRDEHYASVVRYDVLALRRKALLIMVADISSGGKANPA